MFLTLVLVGVVIQFILGAILCSCSWVLSRQNACSISWASPYECGFIASSTSFDSFSFTYLSLLVFFVVFDLEISLLLNLPERAVSFPSFYYYFLFLVVLSIGFLSEFFWGYVRWGY
uniref:NADH-ubiquinone oxidoreductase chain 3 n=1 Tax=Breviscolex orientalis TaxID=137570 RepID=A0A343ESR0_9CEST|nr:NADH dehydrogenase subunit 3 [Breviscolex orientalis]ASL24596.1 NADH dehydrogenase subunit 3 [Breviscolex orientalis]